MNHIIRIAFCFTLFLGSIIQSNSQTHKEHEDTLTKKTLDSIIVSTYLKNASSKYLLDIIGGNIYAGKKLTR